MKVSLPQTAAHATPAKSAGAATTAEKFSIALADAQDSAGGSTPDGLNDHGGHISKRSSSKNEKNSSKSSAANNGSTLSKSTIAVDPNAQDVRAASTSALFWQLGLPQLAPAADESDQPADPDRLKSASVPVPPTAAHLPVAEVSIGGDMAAGGKSAGETAIFPAIPDPIAPGSVVSEEAESKKTVLSNPADHQQTPVSSTNSLSTWAPHVEGTSFKSVANLATLAAPTAKPAETGSKTESGDTVRGATLKMDTSAQAGFTFLQSRGADSSIAPMASASQPPVQPTPNAETKREVLQGHALGGTSMDKPEKIGARSFSEAHGENVDSSRDDASPFKGSAPTSATGQGGSGNSVATAASSPASSTLISPVAMDSRPETGVAAPKSSEGPANSQSTATAQDAAAASEASSLPTGSVHAARLVAGLERSELRLGLRAGEFGNVDIRTSLVRNQFTAEISAERGELGRALQAELPGLQQRLTQQHLPAANVTVQANSSGGSSEFQQGSRQSQSAPATVSIPDSGAQEDSILPLLPVEVTEATERLDIHM